MTPRSQGLLEGFARNLRRLLDLRRIEAPELAEASEVSQDRIERFLDEEEEAGALEVMRLAAALRAEPADLFDGLVWVPNDGGSGEYRYEERGPG